MNKASAHTEKIPNRDSGQFGQLGSEQPLGLLGGAIWLRGGVKGMKAYGAVPSAPARSAGAGWTGPRPGESATIRLDVISASGLRRPDMN